MKADKESIFLRSFVSSLECEYPHSALSQHHEGRCSVTSKLLKPRTPDDDRILTVIGDKPLALPSLPPRKLCTILLCTTAPPPCRVICNALTIPQMYTMIGLNIRFLLSPGSDSYRTCGPRGLFARFGNWCSDAEWHCSPGSRTCLGIIHVLVSWCDRQMILKALLGSTRSIAASSIDDNETIQRLNWIARNGLAYVML